MKPTSCGEYCGPGPESAPGKNHLWVNSETGLWQDFKTGRRGNFIQLVQYLDDISFGEAKTALMRVALDRYSIKVEQDASKKKQVEKFQLVDFFKELTLLPLNDSTRNDPRTKKAFEFLQKRGIDDSWSLDKYPLYLTVAEPYPNRIIIPYIENDRMFFFQARALDSSQKAKYLTPSKEYGVKSGMVVYPWEIKEDITKMDYNASFVFITEGPLKARYLQIKGLPATAVQGSKLGLQQARILTKRMGPDATFVLSFDNDEPGTKGQEGAYNLLVKRFGVKPTHIITCRPDANYNDWEDVPDDLFMGMLENNSMNMGKLEHLISRL